MRDVIVIGAGLAGLMGALVLAEAGLRPLVLAKGQGATHWTGGTLDVLGALPDETSAAAPPPVAPLDALPLLLRLRPDHPYRLVGREGLQTALEHVCAVLSRAGYPFVGDL